MCKLYGVTKDKTAVGGSDTTQQVCSPEGPREEKRYCMAPAHAIHFATYNMNSSVNFVGKKPELKWNGKRRFVYVADFKSPSSSSAGSPNNIHQASEKKNSASNSGEAWCCVRTKNISYFRLSTRVISFPGQWQKKK